ncbi:MAG: FG-GAP repeat domain-containing protein [Candidatus Binatia bacterium]
MSVGLSAGPQAIALVDVNGDGKADILAVDMDHDQLNIYLNHDNGNFNTTPDSTLFTGTTPVAVVTGDFDRDGKLDLAVANEDDNSVTIAFGEGDGNFGFSTAPFLVSTDPYSPIGLAAVDLNGDGAADLAVLSDSSVYLIKSNGDRTFSTFSPSSVGTRTSGAFAIAAGLINNTDTFIDLAISNTSSQVSVLLGKGDGTFQLAKLQNVGTTPQGIVIADLGNGNGSASTKDGKADLAVADQGALVTDNVWLLYGNGDGSFQNALPTTAEENPTALATADFDGDGKIDLGVGITAGGTTGVDTLRNDTEDFNILQVNNENGFSLPLTSPKGLADAVAVQTGDINGDGRPDMIAVNSDGDTLGIYINTTGGVQPTPTPVVVGTPTPTPEFPPTVTPTQPTATPTTTLTPVATPTPTQVPIPYGVCNVPSSLVGGQPVAVAIADFDRNSSADIAVADRAGNRIIILLSKINSTGSTPCEVLGLPPTPRIITGVTAPVALAAGDIDRDGKPDLAVVGADGVTVFFGNGDGTFQPGGTAPMPAGSDPRSIAIADFNRDGRPDLIVANESSNDVSIILGTGNKTFAAACSISVGRKASLVVAQDLNHDGTQDFAVASDQTNDVAVFLQAAPTPGSAASCATLAGNFHGLSAPPLTAGLVPRALVADHLDPNDVPPDLAIAEASNSTDGSVLILYARSTSGAIYAPNPTSVAVPRPPGALFISMPSALGSGDVNGDSQPDLVVADRNNNDVVILLNSSGKFAPLGQPIAVGSAPVGLAMGDIDGDGVPDIVTANQNDGSISVLVSSRPPPTPTPPPTSTPTNTGTATMTPTDTPTPTPTPTATPTVTSTPTRTRPPTITATAAPTNTQRGVIQLQGSCTFDPNRRSGDRTARAFGVIAIGGLWLRRRLRRAGMEAR